MPTTLVKPVVLQSTKGAMEPLPEPVASDQVEVVVRHAHGVAQRTPLSPEIAKAFVDIVRSLNEGRRVVVMEEDRELTPNEASEILGISRPLVVQRMEVGDLPFRYVGSHRRCVLRDVLALKEKIDAQQQAMREMAEIDEELIDKHGLL